MISLEPKVIERIFSKILKELPMSVKGLLKENR
jgi:hypothetical protein